MITCWNPYNNGYHIEIKRIYLKKKKRDDLDISSTSLTFYI